MTLRCVYQVSFVFVFVERRMAHYLLQGSRNSLVADCCYTDLLIWLQRLWTFDIYSSVHGRWQSVFLVATAQCSTWLP